MYGLLMIITVVCFLLVGFGALWLFALLHLDPAPKPFDGQDHDLKPSGLCGVRCRNCAKQWKFKNGEWVRHE